MTFSVFAKPRRESSSPITCHARPSIIRNELSFPIFPPLFSYMMFFFFIGDHTHSHLLNLCTFSHLVPPFWNTAPFQIVFINQALVKFHLLLKVPANYSSPSGLSSPGSLKH